MKDLTLKFLKNSYVIIIIIFVIWMIFFDSNSILVHNELNNDINECHIEFIPNLGSILDKPNIDLNS